MAKTNEDKQTEQTAEAVESAAPEEKTESPEAEAPTREQELEAQIAELNDRLLRQMAEYDNYRKRSVKEKSDAYKDATAKCVSELLAVLDTFERALEVDCADQEFKKGILMTRDMLVAAFDKLGVSEIEAMGKPFDPNLHNAVNQVQDEQFPENTVCNVFQKGYKLGDRVIRHAMVVVANP